MERQCNECCHGCCEYDKEHDCCTRVGVNGQVGVCWMEKTEGEY